MTKTITTNCVDETITLGAKTAARLGNGDFVALVGDLGAGKTVFVKGLARGLGVERYKYVNSPSFVIVKAYEGEMKLYHFDVFRLDMEHFAGTVDYESFFYDDGITVVEWADKIREILPDEYLEIRIAHAGTTARDFTFTAHGERYRKIEADM